MRKILFLFVVAVCVTLRVAGAESMNLSLTDGSTITGDIIKMDDNALMLRLAGEAYVATNVPWSQFSQSSLKQLVANPKIKPLAEPFIEPDASVHSAQAEIKINDVTHPARPENPSFFGGVIGSALGKVILLLLYLANLYAGYEVAIIRARPTAQVVGAAAVLPVIAPIIFLILPMHIEKPEEEMPELVAAQPGGAGQPATQASQEIQIIEASWKTDEDKKKAEPQIFARGKFTFNKRFLETKFAGYFPVPPTGDALKFKMEVKSSTAQLAVERIVQVSMTEVIFETPNGQVTVALTAIQEIKLTPVPPPPTTPPPAAAA